MHRGMGGGKVEGLEAWLVGDEGLFCLWEGETLEWS